MLWLKGMEPRPEEPAPAPEPQLLYGLPNQRFEGSDGASLGFFLHRPPPATDGSRRRRLLVFFHGHGSTGDVDGLARLHDQASFLPRCTDTLPGTTVLVPWLRKHANGGWQSEYHKLVVLELLAHVFLSEKIDGGCCALSVSMGGFP